MPGSAPGIGFDDLRFAPLLGRLLVPAGRSGSLDLIDPKAGNIDAVAGFSTDSTFGGGHDFGVTSADEGDGAVFATDRTKRTLAVVDLSKKQIATTSPLAGGPDYVRFVAATHELWVTEPDAEQIEVFSLEAGKPPHHTATIATKGGPESLVVDGARGRAYAHLWAGATIAIDLTKRAVVETWRNGCAGSRGIALDEARGMLFAGCSEGKATVLDVAHAGKKLGEATTGAGVDIIDYDPGLRHLYVPGAKAATLSILSVSPSGELSTVATLPTAKGAHCVADDPGSKRVFVCDPAHGQLLLFTDAAAAMPHGPP